MDTKTFLKLNFSVEDMTTLAGVLLNESIEWMVKFEESNYLDVNSKSAHRETLDVIGGILNAIVAINNNHKDVVDIIEEARNNFLSYDEKYHIVEKYKNIEGND